MIILFVCATVWWGKDANWVASVQPKACDLEILSNTEISIKGKRYKLDEEKQCFLFNNSVTIKSVKISDTISKGRLSIFLIVGTICFVLGCASLVLLGRIIKKNRKKKNAAVVEPKGTDSGECSAAAVAEAEAGANSEKSKEENSSSTDDVMPNRQEEELNKDVISKNQLVSDLFKDIISEDSSFAQAETCEQKIEYLKNIIRESSTCKSRATILDTVIKFIGGDADEHNVIERIEDLIGVPTITTTDKVLCDTIKTIINKNENVKNIYNEEPTDTDFIEYLTRLFYYIELKLKSRAAQKEESSLKDRLERMKADERVDANRYVLDRLKSAGLGEYRNILSNTTLDDYLLVLMQDLDKVAKMQEQRSESKIISEAVNNSSFSDEDRVVLLQRVVSCINNKISDPAKRLVDVGIFDQLYQLVAKEHIAVNSFEDEECSAEKIDIATLSNVLDGTLNISDFESVRSAVDAYYDKRITEDFINKLEGFDNNSSEFINEIINQLNAALKDSKVAENLRKRFNVDDIMDIPTKVKEQEVAQILESLKNNKDLMKELDVAVCHSVEQIVNELVQKVQKATKETLQTLAKAAKNEELIVEQLSKYYKGITEKDISQTKNILEAIDTYGKKVENTIDGLKQDRSKLTMQNTTLSDEINALRSSIASLVDSCAYKLNSGVTSLSKVVKLGGYLEACDDESESTCDKIESKLSESIAAFRTSVSQMKDLPKDNPQVAYETIQQKLITEIDKEDGAFNTIARYYVYSRLAFMTDQSREYGIRFNRSVISQVYSCLDDILVAFGIKLILPALFAEKIQDGNYENYTGKAYSDLDNLCPNSRNHKDMIDNEDKKDIIIDIIHVGYAKDSVVIKGTKVLM